MSEEYNGWSNWETWNANLWLTNDEGVYEMMQEVTANQIGGAVASRWEVAAAIEEAVGSCADEGIRLIGDDMSMWRIDWCEIADFWITDYEESV